MSQSPDEEAVPADTVSAASSEGSLTPKCDCHLNHQQVCDICQGVMCQADSTAACDPVSASPLQSGDGGEAKWQLIKTAPKDGRKCLVGAYVGTIGSMKAWCVGIAWYSEHKKCWLSQTWDAPPDEQPTHWMPLPPPPRSSDEEPALAGDTVPAASTEASLTQEITRLRSENDKLRAALATSELPCQYCTLSREDWEKCAAGFPGCARADDAMGCPHLGAGLEVSHLRSENASLREALKPFASVLNEVGMGGGSDSRCVEVIVSAMELRRARAVLTGTEAPPAAESPSDATSTTKDT